MNPATAQVTDPSERETRLMPRMTSMLTHEKEAPAEESNAPLATRGLILAAIAALCVVAVVIVVLAHPWNPNLYDTRAQSPADTSMEGFPGTVDKLTGQDTTAADETAEPQLTADEATYQALSDDLTRLDEADAELTKQMAELTDAEAASAESREAWAEDARSLSIGISNLIESIRSADVTTGTYASAQTELDTMGNYLRNRADALTSAWDAILAPLASTEDVEEAIASAEAENRTYAGLYRHARAAFELPAPNG